MDSYSKAETDALLVPKASESWVLATLGGYYTTQEANDAITAALATVDLSPFQNEAQVLALIAAALAPYDDSSQVDSKIITALLDFYTRAETDQAIADAVSGVSVDLSAYFTSAQTQSYVANELLSFYPRTELDSLLTATLTQYWTSERTQTEIDDAIAGVGFQTQADADLRYFVRAPGAESGQIWNLVQEQFTPRIVRNLLLEAPLAGGRDPGQPVHPPHPERYVEQGRSRCPLPADNDLGPLDTRYFVTTPGAEGSGIFNLAQTQFVPNIIRNLLCQTPLSCQPILGNGSTLQISPATAGPGASRTPAIPSSPTSTPWASGSRTWRTARGWTPRRTSRSTR